MVDESFARYLLGELFWELEQFAELGIELQPGDAVVVVSCKGAHDLCVRVGDQEYRIWLSWRGDVPPRIAPVAKDAA